MKLKLKREDISILEKNINNYNHICGIDEVGRGCIAGTGRELCHCNGKK